MWQRFSLLYVLCCSRWCEKPCWALWKATRHRSTPPNNTTSTRSDLWTLGGVSRALKHITIMYALSGPSPSLLPSNIFHFSLCSAVDDARSFVDLRGRQHDIDQHHQAVQYQRVFADGLREEFHVLRRLGGPSSRYVQGTVPIMLQSIHTFSQITILPVSRSGLHQVEALSRTVQT